MRALLVIAVGCLSIAASSCPPVTGMVCVCVFSAYCIYMHAAGIFDVFDVQ